MASASSSAARSLIRDGKSVANLLLRGRGRFGESRENGDGSWKASGGLVGNEGADSEEETDFDEEEIDDVDIDDDEDFDDIDDDEEEEDDKYTRKKKDMGFTDPPKPIKDSNDKASLDSNGNRASSHKQCAQLLRTVKAVAPAHHTAHTMIQMKNRFAPLGSTIMCR
ncbi:unnamed protein product [Arabidopsis halleri]